MGDFKAGDRVVWRSERGGHHGTVMDDQVTSHVRVRPDGTKETGAIEARWLALEDSNDE